MSGIRVRWANAHSAQFLGLDVLTRVSEIVYRGRLAGKRDSRGGLFAVAVLAAQPAVQASFLATAAVHGVPVRQAADDVPLTTAADPAQVRDRAGAIAARSGSCARPDPPRARDHAPVATRVRGGHLEPASPPSRDPGQPVVRAEQQRFPIRRGDQVIGAVASTSRTCQPCGFQSSTS
jgi:hypothetical protein